MLLLIPKFIQDAETDRQRQALARALYARSKVVLLDDVLSGVDAATTELIADRLMGPNGLFRQFQSTVVFATHSGKTPHPSVLGKF